MKQPSERGAAISPQRIRRWLDEFAAYRHQVSEPKIDRWLDQFASADRDAGARLLDSVDFIGYAQISSLFRQLVAAIPGWHKVEGKRSGRWRFVAFSGSSGESGDTMLQLFRLANSLDAKKHDKLFIHRSELLKDKLTTEDTVVLIDDFSATGDQACNSWQQIFRELLPEEPRTFLLLLGAVKDAIKRISDETELRPLVGFRLNDSDNVFARACRRFTLHEKDRLLHYCRIADAQCPKGYGDCGLLIVFPHRCPNNSIPILHANHDRWTGLFPRHD